MRHSPDYSPAILVFPCHYMKSIAREYPTHRRRQMLRGVFWHIRPYKRLGSMSATAELLFDEGLM